MIDIVLINTTRSKNIPSQKQFDRWVHAALSLVPRKKINKSCVEITISLVGEKKSAALNHTFRGKSGPTNILSFTYPTITKTPSHSLGDLIICASLVKKEALAQKKTAKNHWAHLTVHGVLHLLGYDHIIDKEARGMESLEINILKQLGVENPYV